MKSESSARRGLILFTNPRDWPNKPESPFLVKIKIWRVTSFFLRNLKVFRKPSRNLNNSSCTIWSDLWKFYLDSLSAIGTASKRAFNGSSSKSSPNNIVDPGWKLQQTRADHHRWILAPSPYRLNPSYPSIRNVHQSSSNWFLTPGQFSLSMSFLAFKEPLGNGLAVKLYFLIYCSLCSVPYCQVAGFLLLAAHR